MALIVQIPLDPIAGRARGRNSVA